MEVIEEWLMDYKIKIDIFWYLGSILITTEKCQVLYFHCENIVRSASTFKLMPPTWSVKIWEIFFFSPILFLSWWLCLICTKLLRRKRSKSSLFSFTPVLAKSKEKMPPKALGPKGKVNQKQRHSAARRLDVNCTWWRGYVCVCKVQKGRHRRGRRQWAFHWNRVKRNNFFWAPHLSSQR